MIKLSHIIEQYGAENQYYDIGADFAAFNRMIEGSNQQIKQTYEKKMATYLVGKRIKASASRGYKQFVKEYEFDVANIKIEDGYDNFVVIAYDNTTPKPKEYFLKTGFGRKVQILGPSTGKPSPQKGGDPRFEKSKPTDPTTTQPGQNSNISQSQPMALAPAGQTPPETKIKESENKNNVFDAYSVDNIVEDVKQWLPVFFKNPETQIQEFIKKQGWKKKLDNRTSVAIFELQIPFDMVKTKINAQMIQDILKRNNTISNPEKNERAQYSLVKFDPVLEEGKWIVRIKKTFS
ncbi:MAG TPA: hypothetical protein PLC59_00430 [Bacteroidales bacterium]|jgi:hypothetical protein|nr:hypothetical protein [Bacteroidales bacterium]HQI44530.1 hypothetical protein [Bacteroidales bacterium]